MDRPWDQTLDRPWDHMFKGKIYLILINNIIESILVVIIGDSNVGKTSIRKRYVWNKFDEREQYTIAAEYAFHTLRVCRF